MIDEMIIVVKGLIIGVLIAMPVGPVGLLCINRSLSQGKVQGFISGLGAATADAIYASIAAFGLTFVSSFLCEHRLWLRAAGGVALCLLGARGLLSKDGRQERAVRDRRSTGNYLSAFFLTLTNPMTLIVLATIYAAVGLIGAGMTYTSATVLVAAVFVGSSFWWFTLASTAETIRKKLDDGRMAVVNKVSHTAIVAVGLVVLLDVLVRARMAT